MPDALLTAISQLTVGQKVAFSGLIVLAALAAAIALTAALLSARVAAILWLGAAATLVAAMLFLPVDTRDLGPRPDPAPDFAAARARFLAEADRGAPALNPLCPSRLHHHGARTAKAVVLLHGVSSCPQAFVDFAPLVFARGHNVLVLRMPRNGYADRASDALRRLTAEDLRAQGDLAVDIAAGLGEEVVVLGISAGGTVAAWAAQNRAEVDRAVIVAPFFGLADFGRRINLGLMRAMLFLPNVSIWKDPILRARWRGMPHAYARQSSRGTGEVMRLGYAAFRQIAQTAPAGAAAVFVTNDADRAVDGALAGAFGDAFAAWGAPVARFAFPASDGLGHEIVDPMEPGAQPALTHPVLLRAIESPLAALAPEFRLD